MDSEQHIHDAALALAARFASASWFASVGIGGAVSRPLLIVYCSRKLKKSERTPIPLKWQGFPVEARELGRVVPAGFDT